jgi:hypothetical protein
VTQVVVVVPARDEEADIGATLRSVCASLDEARSQGLVGEALLEVTAHRCTDHTESRARAVLRGRTEGRVLRDDSTQSVGEVRDAAARRGLAALPDRPRDTWVLSTDADTRVGTGWVGDILREAARTSVVAVVGLAPLDQWHGGEQGDRAYADLLASKMLTADEQALHQHDHVYGANLAVRADAYLDVGGFAHAVHGEDQALLDALVAAGHPVLRTRSIAVTTSGRLRGRAAGGLAEHLARLDAVSGRPPAAAGLRAAGSPPSPAGRTRPTAPPAGA